MRKPPRRRIGKTQIRAFVLRKRRGLKDELDIVRLIALRWCAHSLWCRDVRAASIRQRALTIVRLAFATPMRRQKGRKPQGRTKSILSTKLIAVDNTKRNTDFMFLPTRLWVERATVKQAADDPNRMSPVTKPATDKSPWVLPPGGVQDWFARRASRRFVPGETNFAQAMGVRAVTPATIPARGLKSKINGYSIVDRDQSLRRIAQSITFPSVSITTGKKARAGRSLPIRRFF